MRVISVITTHGLIGLRVLGWRVLSVITTHLLMQLMLKVQARNRESLKFWRKVLRHILPTVLDSPATVVDLVNSEPHILNSTEP